MVNFPLKNEKPQPMEAQFLSLTAREHGLSHAFLATASDLQTSSENTDWKPMN